MVLDNQVDCMHVEKSLDSTKTLLNEGEGAEKEILKDVTEHKSLALSSLTYMA